MIFTYMCRVCGCSFKTKDFGLIERFVEPCILLLLTRHPAHGYGLLEDLKIHCAEEVDIGNLYRTLRRMEKVGWLSSSWDRGEAGPEKRIYEITTEGKKALTTAASDLTRTRKLIDRFLEGFKKMKEHKKHYPKGGKTYEV